MGHFPRSLHDEILDAVGMSHAIPQPSERAAEGRPSRDPAFRERMLDAYQRRCAVCDHDTRIGDQPLGREAAHIKWRAAGGPDVTANGLALCTLHHKGLDLGALGLLAADGDYRIQISTRVNGLSEAARSLRGLHGRPVRLPDSASDRPASGFVAWHGREVFRQPAIGSGV